MEKQLEPLQVVFGWAATIGAIIMAILMAEMFVDNVKMREQLKTVQAVAQTECASKLQSMIVMPRGN